VRSAINAALAAAPGLLSRLFPAATARQTLLVAATLLATTTVKAQTCPPPVRTLATMRSVEGARHADRFSGRYAAIASQLATNQFAAVVLGDSIVQRWPADLLDAAVGGKTLNAGVEGDITQMVGHELQTMDWSRQRPQFMVLLIGTNNGRVDAPCDVYWGIRTNVDEARKAMPSAHVVVVSILPRGENMTERDADIRLTNRALQEGVSEGGYSVLDAHDAFLCNQETPCVLMTPPHWVHPSRLGYQVLSNLLREHMQQIVR
jgi:lysophospholipase L1-like esterase